MPAWGMWTWLEIAVLAAVSVPAARLALDAPLRRTFPKVSVAIGAVVSAWLVFGVGLAVLWPAALHLLTAGTLALGAAGLWRARASFGRSRGLPPGSLSILASIAAIADRDFYRRAAARYGPIFKMAQFHQPVVCVVGLERGHRLLRDHEPALGPSLQRVTEEIPGGFLRYMDRATHDVYGPLFRQALSARVVADAGPAIRAAARHELASAFAGRRAIDPTPVLERLTDAAFLRTLFGIAPGSADFAAMIGAYQPLGRLALSESLTPAARASLVELRRLVRRGPTGPPGAPGSGTPPRCALTELRQLDPRMPDDTCVDNLLFIWKISASNAVGLLRWLLALLGENPEWRERLTTGLQRGVDPPQGLLDRVISETLRLSQSEYLYRRVREDIVFDGFTVPKRWLVRICVWESHRDPLQFEDPERFNPDRFLDRDPPRTAYAPFGAGRHACNGVPLAMEIARAFLEELSRAGHWSVDGGGALDRDFRHWSHWRPGPGLRVVLDRPTETDVREVSGVRASEKDRGRSAPEAEAGLP